MQAWQQRVDNIHHRQQQRDRPDGKRQRLDDSAQPVKRALFATASTGQDVVNSRVSAAEGISSDEGTAEDDVSGVELLHDGGTDNEKNAEEKQNISGTRRNDNQSDKRAIADDDYH